jgi:NhaP-type Na+/H+ or K+/H+ antiporter
VTAVTAVTAATSGHFSVLPTAGSIVYSAAAGAVIGLVVGMIGRRLRDRVDDPSIEIVGSILLPTPPTCPPKPCTPQESSRR